MLRKIKKWYFKIYHLFKLLGIFILIFGVKEIVYAEECTNLIRTQNWLYWNGSYFLTTEENKTDYYLLEPLTNYTIFFDYGEENFNEIINTQTAVQEFQIWQQWGTRYQAEFTVNMTKKSYTFKTEKDLSNNNLKKYFRMNGISGNTVQTPFIDGKEHEFWLVKGTEVCRKKEEEPTENNIYSNFLSLYTDKINYLADGFTKNQYLLTMIGIIFSFVVLELFLKILYLKGGYRR